MLSPGFVDILLFLVFITFTLKGFITGFIRSVVTLVAVIIAFGLSAAMPTILAPILGYSIPSSSMQFLVINRIASFFLFFGVTQSIGFLATGLLEKIGLGTADKAVGALLGVITGVLVGCVPGIAIYQSAKAYHYKPNQRYFQASFFMKTYTPIIKAVVKPPKAPATKRKHSAADDRVVT